MGSNQADGWQVKINLTHVGSGNPYPTFQIGRYGSWAVLEEGGKLDASQEDLIYQFSKEAVSDSTFWESLLQHASVGIPELPYDLSIRFLEQLRKTIEGGRVRHEQLRLLWQLATMEGRRAHSEQHIWNLLNFTIDMKGVESASLLYEEKVLRIATDERGLLKAAVSDQIIEKVVWWLTRRGAVDRIRALFRPLPWIFRQDPARVLITFAFFLGGVVLAEHSGGTVCGRTALIATLLIVAFVMWTLSASALKLLGPRWTIGIRPAFEVRWQSLSTAALVTVSSSVIATFIARSLGSTAITVLILGMLSAGWFWRRFCGRSLKEIPGGPQRAVVNHRMGRLLSLNIEEAFAFGLIADAVNYFVVYSISEKYEPAADWLATLGLKFPPAILFDLGTFSYQMRPACTIVITGLMLIFCWLVALQRSRLP